MNEHEQNPKKLYRSGTDHVIGGVCAGLAEYLNVDAKIIRIIAIVLIFANGIGLLAYLVGLVLVPVNPEHVKLPPSEKVPQNNSLYGGIALIIAGLMFLSNNIFGHFWFYRWRWFDFWPFHFHLVWPLLIIGAGVWLLVNAGKQDTHIKTGVDDVKNALPRFVRIREGKMVSGVCTGLAHYWKVDVTIIRVIFIIFTLVTHIIFGLGIYIVLVIIIPEQNNPVIVTADKTINPEAK